MEHEPGPLVPLQGALPLGLVLSKAAIHTLTGEQHLRYSIESSVSLNRLWQGDQRSGSGGGRDGPRPALALSLTG